MCDCNRKKVQFYTELLSIESSSFWTQRQADKRETLNGGVPQASVLGPYLLLFNFVITFFLVYLISTVYSIVSLVSTFNSNKIHI